VLLEIAIGDAYGAGFEFSDSAKIARLNDGLNYSAHDLGEIAPGRYTDDTQMSIAVAEAVLSGQHLDETTFAHAFVEAYRRDPRPGYAKGLQALLDQCSSGTDLLHRIRADSTRNGAAMRSVPLGLLPDEERVSSAAITNARVTHATLKGILSSRCVALAAHGLVYGKARIDTLGDYLAPHVGISWPVKAEGPVECDGLQTVQAALSILCAHRSMASLLKACVALGGDTDSTAAISLGLASLSTEYTNDLPASLHSALENGAYGRDFLRSLDERIQARLHVRSPG
jgi:ADP-ribosyl-[dinitrogen reductase] hydrolase